MNQIITVLKNLNMGIFPGRDLKFPCPFKIFAITYICFKQLPVKFSWVFVKRY